MTTRIKKRENASALEVPRENWSKFLKTFSRQHHGRLMRLETYDRVTGEDVVSQETPLESIELDLEDETNPRINVIVRLDNKLIKHILFLPSLVAVSSHDRQDQLLRIETVNTQTTVHFRAPAPRPPA